MEILEQLKKSKLLQNVQFVSVFISLPDEVETQAIVEYCWENDIIVGVPELHHTGEGQKIDIRQWNEHDELMEVHHGIKHPRSGKLYTLKDVELVFVPGLAFSEDGQRLGRGMGFYDRLITQCEGKTIGLCFKEQIQSEIPLEDHDQKVDQVLTC